MNQYELIKEAQEKAKEHTFNSNFEELCFVIGYIINDLKERKEKEI